MFKRKHVKILKHHRNLAVYIDGRYLCVDMKISTRSKRGREIARETAEAILAEVGGNEEAFQLGQAMAKNTEPMEVEIAPYSDGPGLTSDDARAVPITPEEETRLQRQLQDASALASRSPSSQEAPVGEVNMGELEPVTVQDPPQPPDSFTEEEGRAAVSTVIDRREQSAQRTDESDGHS